MRERSVHLCILLSAVAASCTGCDPAPQAIQTCQEEVRSLLLSPASAEFSAIEASPRYGSIYTVEGLVDASNPYGVMLRNEFYCIVEASEVDAFLDDDFQRYYERVEERIREAKRSDPNLRPPDVVTYAQYRSLKEGMTLDQANRIIGHEGTGGEMMVRVQGGAVATYRWVNYDGSQLVVEFSGDELVDAHSYGLW